MIKAARACLLPLILTLAITAAPLPAVAEDVAELDAVTLQITEQLPAWIKVDSVAFLSSEQSGDSLVSTIEISVSAREDLYQKGSFTLDIRDFTPPGLTMIALLTKSGEAKVIAGTAETYLDDGVVQTTPKFDVEHAVRKMGQPRTAFPASAVLIGSEEYKAVHAETKAKADAAKQESRRQMLEILSTFGAPELSETTMAAMIESLLDDHHQNPDIISVTKLDFIRNSPTAVLPGDGRLGLEVYSLADVTANQDLYMVDTLQTGLESLQFLKVSVKAGETVKIFARASLLFADGEWDFAFGRKNSTTIRVGTSEKGGEYHRIGYPLAAFEGDGLPIFGTPEFDAAQAAITKNKED